MKEAIKTLIGHRPPPAERVGLDALIHDWNFHASRPSGTTVAIRLATLPHLRRAPAFSVMKALGTRPRWIFYFVYLPTGGLTAAHRFTLERLRQADAALCVICASPSPTDVPDELNGIADALYWKALSGFDFSAYALAISETARFSPGADTLILNDSVFGPFVAVDDLWPAMRWDLTGFTAFAQTQNHIQSYAFYLRRVTPETVRSLRPVLPRNHAFDHYRGAVFWQESRLATVAAKTMSVGAWWYADARRSGDPSIVAALPLVRAGFPFLKRSLLSKNSHIWPRKMVLDTLRDLGHPLP